MAYDFSHLDFRMDKLCIGESQGENHPCDSLPQYKHLTVEGTNSEANATQEPVQTKLMDSPDEKPQSDSEQQRDHSNSSPSPESKHVPLALPDDVPPPPLHFVDKLHTNYIPSTPEIKDVKQYVNAVKEKLSAYDARIAELEAALLEVMNQRKQLHDIGNAHEALISPLRRVPPEILQMIFVWCLPTNRNSVMHASEAPVLIGRVCSEWRRISLATPEVWSSLHIVPPNVNFSNPTSSTSRFQRKRELIEMWLARSGACPLNISFVWFAGDSDDETKLCGSLLEVLVPMCGRWRVLDFQVPLKMFKPFVGLTVKDVPLLEGMSLMDNRTPLDTDTVDRWPESLTFAESAAKLRTFTLTFFSGGIRLPSIPWSQLTTLYLESNIAFFFQDSREMLSTLSECSNLESCTLKFPLSHTASLPAYEKLDMPINLPQLHTLCLDGDQHLHNTFHMSNTLMNLCVPKLRKLEILGRSGRPDGSAAPEPLSAIRTLLLRSRCPLERLNVESMTMLPEEFVACLRLVPTLTDLVVHNWALRLPASGSPFTEDTQNSAGDIAENVILKALTVSPKSVSAKADDGNVRTDMDVGNGDVALGGGTPTGDVLTTHSEASGSEEKKESMVTEAADFVELLNPVLDPIVDSDGVLCPQLQKFDFTLCDASQNLLCDFVSSRFDAAPEGIARLKSVKCNFTAFEDEAVKKRMQEFRLEGLDAFVTYQVPVSDDLNPSPWTGLEAPP